MHSSIKRSKVSLEDFGWERPDVLADLFPISSQISLLGLRQGGSNGCRGRSVKTHSRLDFSYLGSHRTLVAVLALIRPLYKQLRSSHLPFPPNPPLVHTTVLPFASCTGVASLFSSCLYPLLPSAPNHSRPSTKTTTATSAVHRQHLELLYPGVDYSVVATPYVQRDFTSG